MNQTEPDFRKPKYLENLLLVALGMLAHVPLLYQWPRSAQGLDPYFVHPKWIEQSPFPYAFWTVKIPSFIWLLLMVFAFVRLCRNYGWKLER